MEAGKKTSIDEEILTNDMINTSKRQRYDSVLYRQDSNSPSLDDGMYFILMQ